MVDACAALFVFLLTNRILAHLDVSIFGQASLLGVPSELFFEQFSLLDMLRKLFLPFFLVVIKERWRVRNCLHTLRGVILSTFTILVSVGPCESGIRVNRSSVVSESVYQRQVYELASVLPI